MGTGRGSCHPQRPVVTRDRPRTRARVAATPAAGPPLRSDRAGQQAREHASGPSRHNLRIDGLEFTARIVDFHLPVHAALRTIDVGGPRRHFAVQRPEVADAAPAQALACHGTQLVLCDGICLPGDSAKMRAENGSEPGMPGLAPEVTLAGRWLHTGRLHGHGAAVAVEYKCSGGGRPPPRAGSPVRPASWWRRSTDPAGRGTRPGIRWPSAWQSAWRLPTAAARRSGDRAGPRVSRGARRDRAGSVRRSGSGPARPGRPGGPP